MYVLYLLGPQLERLFGHVRFLVLFLVAIVGMLIDEAGPAWFLVAVLARELVVGGAVAIATLSSPRPPANTMRQRSATC